MRRQRENKKSLVENEMDKWANYMRKYRRGRVSGGRKTRRRGKQEGEKDEEALGEHIEGGEGQKEGEGKEAGRMKKRGRRGVERE